MHYLILILLCGSTQAFSQYFDWDVVTALDEYVQRDDGYYEYTLLEMYDEPGYTMLVLEMTSQIWMDIRVTTEPIWTHHLSIAVPDVIIYPDAAHLYIGDGSNDDDPPYPDSESRMTYIADFCRNTGAIAAYLKQVPNQPLYFTDTPSTPRYEDEIIARAWRYYIEELIDDTDLHTLLPMTKAAKTAVDTIVKIIQDRTGNTIERIMPAGISKRGWTSWLLGCVDPRVFAMAPIVFDIGNMHENLHHHNRAYGGWSWAFEPYWNENITMYTDHPRSIYMIEEVAVDFMRYNSRLTMPKLISIATNDEFFLTGDSHYFFHELSEPKFMVVFENADHGLDEHIPRLNQNMMNFFVAVLEGFQFPDISWERLEHGSHADLDMICNDEMNNITAWWADTTRRTCENATIDEEVGEELICRKDFRFDTLIPPGANPVEWEETDVLDLGGGLYRVRMDYRDDEVDGPGYRGFFMSMVFPGFREEDELHFTTEVHIIPDNLPYPRCTTEEECHGRLV